MKWNELTISQKADLMKIYVNNGFTSLDSIKEHYNKLEDGGPIGGYSEDTLEERKNLALTWDPTGGYVLSQTIFKGNPTGEEQAYFNTYLGLEENIPKMNPKAKTEWDDKIEAEKASKGELPSDFYGTTPRMDLNIQAIADTLNTGKILRNYDTYKQANPSLPHISKIQRMYNKGKEILDNPNTWHDVDGNVTAIKSRYDSTTDEKEPLGMLSHFGMKWDDKNNTIYIQDTYDFKKLYRKLGGIPERPKEMKIRGAISFDPKKGSKLLRNNLESFNDYPEPIRGSRNFKDGGKKKSILNPERVADRVYGDGIKTGGPFSALNQYIFGKKGQVEDRINKAEQFANTHSSDYKPTSGYFINTKELATQLDSKNLEFIKQHEDAKRLYLGLEPKYGTMEPSPYRPTIGKAENNTYQVNPLLTDEEFENSILPRYIAWKNKQPYTSYSEENSVIDRGKNAQLLDFPYLSGATMSEGFDNKGQYISLYDKWDYNTKVARQSGDNISKWIGGKPFDIYQRYYLDDWFDIPEDSRGNPWIVPSVIIAK